MATLQLLFNAKLTHEKLDLSAITVITTGTDIDLREKEAVRVARDGHGLAVDLPEAGTLDIRILGFSGDGHSYAMSARSRLENQPFVLWSASGADAVSPTFSAEGLYVLEVLATPTDDPNGIKKPSTLPIKLGKPGKDDDFPS
jgi:predicted DNA binding protein